MLPWGLFRNKRMRRGSLQTSHSPESWHTGCIGQGDEKRFPDDGKVAVQGGWLFSQPHDMILGKMKQHGAQANAARCISHRSALQRATQRTAFVASPFCSAHCIRYTKTIHPARCIRPFTFEWPRSRIPKRRKRLKRARQQHRRPHRSPSAWNAHRAWPTEEGVSSSFPEQAPPEAQAACIAPCRKPQGCGRQNDWPRGAFFHILGSQWHISGN